MSSLKSINWRPRLKPILASLDGLLLTALLILMILGLVTIYSSSSANEQLFYSHLRNMVLSLVVLVAVAQIPPERLISLAVPLYTLGVALLVAVAIFGITKKGAKRWLNLGFIVVQPSEILKISTPLVMAWWFQRREGSLRKIDWLIAGILLIIPTLLIMHQPDLGTALLILMAGFSVIFLAGIKWRYIIPPAILATIGIILIIVFEPQICASGVHWPILHDYQQQRVCTLLDPMRDPLGSGFHTLQGMIAIGSGGFWGSGFMEGTQTRLQFIPERTTDFIFAAYSEEFGFFGNLVLIVIYLFLVMRSLFIALAAPSLFSRLLAGSMAVIFFAYAFVNMGMVSGILPVVGVPLPFVSYGGTAMVTLGFALGILMSIAKAKHLIQS